MNTQAKFLLDDTEYTLEMTRDTVRRLEASGFNLEAASSFPATLVDTLFHAALVKNHRGMDPKRAKKVLDTLVDEEGYDLADIASVLVEMYEEVFTLSETLDVSQKKSLTVVKGNTTL